MGQLWDALAEAAAEAGVDLGSPTVRAALWRRLTTEPGIAAGLPPRCAGGPGAVGQLPAGAGGQLFTITGITPPSPRSGGRAARRLRPGRDAELASPEAAEAAGVALTASQDLQARCSGCHWFVDGARPAGAQFCPASRMPRSSARRRQRESEGQQPQSGLSATPFCLQDAAVGLYDSQLTRFSISDTQARLGIAGREGLGWCGAKEGRGTCKLARKSPPMLAARCPHVTPTLPPAVTYPCPRPTPPAAQGAGPDWRGGAARRGAERPGRRAGRREPQLLLRGQGGVHFAGSFVCLSEGTVFQGTMWVPNHPKHPNRPSNPTPLPCHCDAGAGAARPGGQAPAPGQARGGQLPLAAPQPALALAPAAAPAMGRRLHESLSCPDR